MKLPNHTHAAIPDEKLTEYLLSDTHPEGKDKAAFFKAFSFSLETRETLADALLVHASEHEIARIVPSTFGIRYVIEGRLETPDQRNPLVRVVWFIEFDTDIPRLVTAYPL